MDQLDSPNTDAIENIKVGQTLQFPAAGHYPAMTVRCTAADNLTQPTRNYPQKCMDVISMFTADSVCHINGCNTYAKTGDDKRQCDVRLDNEGTVQHEGRYYARLRIQANGVTPSPTFAVMLAQTDPKPNKEGPFLGQNRLRAALRGSVNSQGAVWVELTN